LVKVHSDIMNEQTGVQPFISQEDIKRYLDEY